MAIGELVKQVACLLHQAIVQGWEVINVDRNVAERKTCEGIVPLY